MKSLNHAVQPPLIIPDNNYNLALNTLKPACETYVINLMNNLEKTQELESQELREEHQTILIRNLNLMLRFFNLKYAEMSRLYNEKMPSLFLVSDSEAVTRTILLTLNSIEIELNDISDVAKALD